MKCVIVVYHRRGCDMGGRCSQGGERGWTQHVIAFSASGSRLRAVLDLDNSLVTNISKLEILTPFCQLCFKHNNIWK